MSFARRGEQLSLHDFGPVDESVQVLALPKSDSCKVRSSHTMMRAKRQANVALPDTRVFYQIQMYFSILD